MSERDVTHPFDSVIKDLKLTIQLAEVLFPVVVFLPFFEGFFVLRGER